MQKQQNRKISKTCQKSDVKQPNDGAKLAESAMTNDVAAKLNNEDERDCKGSHPLKNLFNEKSFCKGRGGGRRFMKLFHKIDFFKGWLP